MKKAIKKFIQSRFKTPKKYLLFFVLFSLGASINIWIVESSLYNNFNSNVISGSITIFYSFILMLVWSLYENP